MISGDSKGVNNTRYVLYKFSKGTTLYRLPHGELLIGHKYLVKDSIFQNYVFYITWDPGQHVNTIAGH